MPEEKFVSRVLLIGLAIVILIILVTQYQSKKSTSTSGVNQEAYVNMKHALEKYSEPQLFGADQSIIKPAAAPSKTASVSQSKAESKNGGAAQANTVVANSVEPVEPLSNELYKAVDFNTENKLPTDCFPRDKLTAEDLLPKDAANSKWAQVSPAGQGDVKDQNFMTAGYMIGINTVGQSLRNPNYQLRSDPPNVRMNVGPWNQSTIESDVSRRYFEIGEC